jgi:hypothetical protein
MVATDTVGAYGEEDDRPVALTARFRVRATRANPVGFASEPERREVYAAALAQFDELMSAASSSGRASRPLPLFYALSQAGRALAAAHATRSWRLYGHGLAAADLDHPLLTVKIRRTSSKTASGTRKADSFTGIAGATGAQAFKRAVTLGRLWASLPELIDLRPPGCGIAPLLLVPDKPSRAAEPVYWRQVCAIVVGFDGYGEELIAHLRRYFPTSEGVRLFEDAGFLPINDHKVWWTPKEDNVEGHLSTLERVTPRVHDFSPRWLLPYVGGVALSPLLTWWTLLFGLSMMARYEPATWVAALDYDSSELAAPLEGLLDTALDRVPELVLSALETGLAPAPVT